MDGLRERLLDDQGGESTTDNTTDNNKSSGIQPFRVSVSDSEASSRRKSSGARADGGDDVVEEHDPIADALFDEHNAKRSVPWQSISCMIVAVILGLGVLGLPKAVAQLGWVLGMFFLLISGVGAVYSGVTIANVVGELHGRRRLVQSYSDLGFASFGVRGRNMVKTVQYIFLGGVLVAVQYVSSQSLRQVVRGSGRSICVVSCNLIVAAAMVPLMQIQHLKEAVWMAALGVLMIVLPLLLFFSEISHAEENGSQAGFPSQSGFNEFASSLTSIVFAYQGQTIFPELISHMARPADFPRAVKVSTAFMTLVYGIVSIVGYYLMGGDALFITTYVDHYKGTASITSAGNCMLVIHLMAGYLINGNVMNHVVFAGIFRSSGGHMERRLPWLCTTLITLSVSFLLSNAIPNVDSLIDILGATCGCALTFVFPPLFALRLIGPRLTRTMRFVHMGVLAIMLPFIPLGTYVSFKELIDGLRDSPTTPFKCG
eukprot:m.133166 g.133166  ORF g.133166 m.133166 type:complete len:486 (-) comp16504_c1_seq1:393-1850(-)